MDIPISVLLGFNSQNFSVKPLKIKWHQREYFVTKIGLHHTYRQGRTLFHVFSVSSDTAYFRLILNTDNLHWHLTEVSEK